MNQEALDQINSVAAAQAKFAKDRIHQTYFQFAAGMMAITAMIVYPIIFQLNGVNFNGDGIQWLPSIWAFVMGVVLVFVWNLRFKSDRAKAVELKDDLLNRMNNLAAAITKIRTQNGLSPVEVNAFDSAPKLVLQHTSL